jgi:putative zinc finger/helix-turn-helix YgiT family protein
MKCLQCGGQMERRRGNYVYDQGGLNVTLVGVEITKCGKCGEEEVEIPRVEELHRKLALAIVAKPKRLSGAEVRFLRKSVGWSSGDFARRIHVDAATVSRWETGAQPIGLQADLLLRALVIVSKPVESYPVQELSDRFAEVEDESAPPVRLDAKFSGKTWKADPADLHL